MYNYLLSLDNLGNAMRQQGVIRDIMSTSTQDVGSTGQDLSELQMIEADRGGRRTTGGYGNVCKLSSNFSKQISQESIKGLIYGHFC